MRIIGSILSALFRAVFLCDCVLKNSIRLTNNTVQTINIKSFHTGKTYQVEDKKYVIIPHSAGATLKSKQKYRLSHETATRFSNLSRSQKMMRCDNIDNNLVAAVWCEI